MREVAELEWVERVKAEEAEADELVRVAGWAGAGGGVGQGKGVWVALAAGVVSAEAEVRLVAERAREDLGKAVAVVAAEAAAEAVRAVWAESGGLMGAMGAVRALVGTDWAAVADGLWRRWRWW